jgi:hypothetical protein
VAMTNFDKLRGAVARVDALAAAVEQMFDEPNFGRDVDRERLERVAELIGVLGEAAAAALRAVDALNAEMLHEAIPDPDPSSWEDPK